MLVWGASRWGLLGLQSYNHGGSDAFAESVPILCMFVSLIASWEK